MINFNQPTRWLILQYRPGAGGKFLLSCLQTIDKVAHWDPRVEHKEMSFTAWVDQQWTQCGSDKWIAYEPMHTWDSTFFSRTYPRGNNISINEYNRLMNKHANPYLKEVLSGDKLILDYVCKATLPVWWTTSTILKLDAPIDCDVYKRFLLGKIYPYNSKSKKGTVMLDKPLSDNKYQNAKLYNNQYEFGPFESADDWYRHIRFNDFKLNFKIDNPDIFTKNLLNYDLLETHIDQIAKQLNSKFDKDNLNYLFNYWIKKKLIFVDTDLNNLYN